MVKILNLNNDVFLESVLYINDDTFFNLIKYIKNKDDKEYLINLFFSNQKIWKNEDLFLDLIEKKYFYFIMFQIKKNDSYNIFNNNELNNDNKIRFIKCLKILIQNEQLEILNYIYDNNLINEHIHQINVEFSIQYINKPNNIIFDFLVNKKFKLKKNQIIEQSLFYSNNYIYEKELNKSFYEINNKCFSFLNFSFFNKTDKELIEKELIEEDLDNRKDIYIKFKNIKNNYYDDKIFATTESYKYTNEFYIKNITHNHNLNLVNQNKMDFTEDNLYDYKLKYFLNYFDKINEYVNKNKIYKKNINDYYNITSFFYEFSTSVNEKYILTLLNKGFLKLTTIDNFSDMVNAIKNKYIFYGEFNLIEYICKYDCQNILLYILNNKKEYFNFAYPNKNINDTLTYDYMEKYLEFELKKYQDIYKNFDMFRMIHKYYPYEFTNELFNTHLFKNYNSDNIENYKLFFDLFLENKDNIITIFNHDTIQNIINKCEKTKNTKLFEYICENFYYLIQNNIENILVYLINEEKYYKYFLIIFNCGHHFSLNFYNLFSKIISESEMNIVNSILKPLMTENKIKIPQILCDLCCANGKINIIKYLYSFKYQFSPNLLTISIQYSRYDTFNFLISKGYKPNEECKKVFKKLEFNKNNNILTKSSTFKLFNDNYENIKYLFN